MANNIPTLDDFESGVGKPRSPRSRRNAEIDESEEITQQANQNNTERKKRTATETTSKPKRGKLNQKQDTQHYTLVDFFCDVRLHKAFGIFLGLLSLIIAACVYTNICNYDIDQSAVWGKSLIEIAENESIETLLGAIGAKVAEVLLIKTFGVSSLVIAIYLFILSYAILQKHAIKFFTLTFRCLFSIISLSIILGFFTYNSSMTLPIGGNHGHYINALVIKYSDIYGAFALTVFLTCLLFTVFYFQIKDIITFITTHLPHPKKRENPVVAEIVETGTDPLEGISNKVSDNIFALNSDIEEPIEEPNDDIPEDHRRFMPPADIDDFGKDEEEPKDDEPINDDSKKDIEENAEDKNEANSGPELVIVNDSIDTSSNTIRDGDHIGIDEPYDVRASHSSYTFPPLDLLIDRPKTFTVNEDEQLANKELIVNSLRSYNVEIEKIQATIGPTVTLYEIVPAQGTRIAKIKSLEDDIAMSLAAYGIRIIAPIPGKGTIGLEVPNRKPQIVSMRTILESDKFQKTDMKLPMALGSTISNEIFMVDLVKMPHLLVAGATGQGKSVGLNCIITSLLYSKHPDELKFVLIDPKMVEFSLYSSIDRQYLAKIPEEESAVITDPNKALDTLNSLCVEMDDRYQLLRTAGVRSIEEYNQKFCSRALNPEQGHRFLPYIVMIVDEYADLVMTASKDISAPICRIAQKARAVGMHMIIATQRPSTDIITGKIKANFPARIAFKVTQGVDSKTILDRPGAQRLIGRGDMLVMSGGTTERVQCAWVDTPEVESICQHISNQPGFTGCYLLPEPPTEEAQEVSPTDMTITDEFRKCAMFISTQSQASITMLQRKFEIGFNKAGRFMDQMQQLGIVGPANGAKPRQVLMSPDEVERILS